MVCLFIERLNLALWTAFAFPFQTVFQYVRLLKRRQAATLEDRCTSLASPESGALLYLFTTEICEISFTTLTISMRN